jgi:hypothetical protein
MATVASKRVGQQSEGVRTETVEGARVALRLGFANLTIPDWLRRLEIQPSPRPVAT